MRIKGAFVYDGKREEFNVDLTPVSIQELNRRRAEAAQALHFAQAWNVPMEYEKRLAQDARYRLISDAADRTEREYQAALSKLSTDELIALSKAPTNPT